MLLTIEISAALFETILVYIYLCSLFAPKSKHISFVSYGVFFVMDTILSLFVSNAPIRMFLLTFLLILLTKFLFQCRTISAVFAAIMFSALLVVLELLSMGILYLFHFKISDLMLHPIYRAIFIILAKTIQLGIILLIAALGKEKIFDLPFTKLLPLFGCQVFNILLCIFLLNTAIRLPNPSSILLPVCLFGILYINIILYVYLLYLKAGYEAIHEKLLAEQQLSMQKEYYTKLYEEQERTRSLWHDMKKQLNAVFCLMQTENTQAQGCLDEITEQFQQLGKMVRYDNPILSAILNNNIQQALKAGIPVDCEVMTASEFNISPLTLNIVISNTFENAMEACIKLPAAQRSIYLRIRQTRHLLSYEIRNPYDPKAPDLRRDRELHGYGLPNVRKKVESNGGTFLVDKDDNVFCVCITLNV